MAAKKPIKETVTEKKAETKTEKKWKAGKYLYLKYYCGKFGEFFPGMEYEFTEEQAEIFGKAGEIKCS